MTSARIDRFETQPRDAGGRITAGWRITRYAFGTVSMQHLRTGRSHTGADDGFGNIVQQPARMLTYYLHTDDLLEYYRTQ